MLRRIRASLSAKVFFITFVMQLVLGGVLCAILIISSPKSIDMSVNEDVDIKFEALIDRLEQVRIEDSGDIIDGFIRDTGVPVAFTTTGNVFSQITPDFVKTPSELAISSAEDRMAYRDEDILYDESVITCGGERQFFFLDNNRRYTASYVFYLEGEKVVEKTMIKCLPVFLITLPALSLICSFLYTMLFARPVRKISKVSESMSDMNFDVRCNSKRTDELGRVANDLDNMAGRLSNAFRELKEQNSLLLKEIARVNELQEQKTVFFAAASHELKTPVTILEGQIDGMIDEVGPYKDRDLYLMKAKHTVKRMENLIAEILMVSRLQTGDGMGHSRVDIGEVLSDSIADCADLFEARGITMETDIDDKMFLDGDKELTKIAISSFLSNAAFYSNEGEKVSVTAHDAGKIIVEIRNFGAHIDEKDLEHLFEAFYRTDSSRSRRTGGSGLGLYLAKLIIDRQGGNCTVINESEDVLARIELPST